MSTSQQQQQQQRREQWSQLMAQAQQGDRTAYSQLLTQLLPVIRRLAARQIADAALTEDVIQDVLLTLHRVRHTYDPACPFLPWLMAIVSARSIDALRQRGRAQRWQRAETEDSAEETAALAAREDEPDSLTGQYDSQKELNNILGQLPLRQREVVEDVHLREMSLADVASKSQLSVAAVKSLLHRALSSLRRYGEKHDRSS